MSVYARLSALHSFDILSNESRFTPIDNSVSQNCHKIAFTIISQGVTLVGHDLANFHQLSIIYLLLFIGHELSRTRAKRQV